MSLTDWCFGWYLKDTFFIALWQSSHSSPPPVLPLPSPLPLLAWFCILQRNVSISAAALKYCPPICVRQSPLMLETLRGCRKRKSLAECSFIYLVGMLQSVMMSKSHCQSIITIACWLRWGIFSSYNLKSAAVWRVDVSTSFYKILCVLFSNAEVFCYQFYGSCTSWVVIYTYRRTCSYLVTHTHTHTYSITPVLRSPFRLHSYDRNWGLAIIRQESINVVDNNNNNNKTFI